MRGRIGWLLGLTALAWTAQAGCAESGRAEQGGCAERDRVSFQVERTREVANDWVRAVVGVSDEDPDPAALADRVNRTMAWGLEAARAAEGVTVKSGGYNTYPVHEQGKLRRWRASQELILEGGDADAISALVGHLQSRLQLRSLEFQVSPERRRAVEDELIAEALEAFKARAEIVRQGLGAAAYAIGDVSIGTGGAVPPPPMMRMAMSADAESVAPPAIEGGSSRLTVHVSGAIILE